MGETITKKPRDDMEMSVEDDLPSRTAIVHADIEPITTDRIFDTLADPFHGLDTLDERLFWNIIKRLVMDFWDH